MSFSAKCRGLGGTVIDGGVRDKDDISELGYPVFAKTIIPVGTHKSNQGSICKSVSCDQAEIIRLRQRVRSSPCRHFL